MGCNCGGSFQIDDGLVEAPGPPVVGDESYFHNGTAGVTSEQAITTSEGVPVWNPETGKTEDAA